MLPITKILWPTDFSEPSYEALKVADEMALHFSAELIITHVVTPIPVIPIHDDPTSFNLPMYEKEMEASAEKSLDRISREKVSQAVNRRFKVIYGDPATQIVRVATDETVDLIVIATHGLTGWRKFMFGSVTEKVIRMSPHPVLSIRISPEKE
jgi:nucleotide-binding universal stress UspA family protein